MIKKQATLSRFFFDHFLPPHVIPIDLMNRSILNEDKFSVARRLIEQ